MALEILSNDLFPYFNLYAIDNGHEVLMTKDHIIPIAQGGSDDYENYQTMCAICNNIKADATTLTLKDVNELKQIYNENVNRLSPKKFAALMNEEKAKRSK